MVGIFYFGQTSFFRLINVFSNALLHLLSFLSFLHAFYNLHSLSGPISGADLDTNLHSQSPWLFLAAYTLNNLCSRVAFVRLCALAGAGVCALPSSIRFNPDCIQGGYIYSSIYMYMYDTLYIIYFYVLFVGFKVSFAASIFVTCFLLTS